MRRALLQAMLFVELLRSMALAQRPGARLCAARLPVKTIGDGRSYSNCQGLYRRHIPRSCRLALMRCNQSLPLALCPQPAPVAPAVLHWICGCRAYLRSKREICCALRAARRRDRERAVVEIESLPPATTAAATPHWWLSDRRATLKI